jgi:hypothetical protein
MPSTSYLRAAQVSGRRSIPGLRYGPAAVMGERSANELVVHRLNLHATPPGSDLLRFAPICSMTAEITRVVAGQAGDAIGSPRRCSDGCCNDDLVSEYTWNATATTVNCRSC